MKSPTLQSILLAAGLLLAIPSVASAQQYDGGSDMSPGPIGQVLNGLNPANWKMPQMKMPKMKLPQLPKMGQLLPTKQEKKRVIEKKNGFVDEVSQTAKNSWKRTKETLNPMRLIPAGFKQNRTTEPAPKKEGGFFSNLFLPSKETPPKSATPSDFLRQDPVR